jgi:hypothetical protein
MSSPRISFGAIALLLLGSAVAFAQQEPSAPANPVNLDFEAGADQRGLPVGWIGGAPGYDMAWDPTVAHHGEASGRIARHAGTTATTTPASLSQWISAERWRGKRVRLSGWLRTQHISSGWAGLWMRVDSPTTPALAFDNMQKRGLHGTSDWAKYEVVLDVPKAASDIYFGAVLTGDGIVWADDVALEEVPLSVPTTALPQTGKP